MGFQNVAKESGQREQKKRREVGSGKEKEEKVGHVSVFVFGWAGDPKAPRLKKFNKSIDFCKNSIFD